ncbi:MAG: RsmD family RNA methyltransferase [Rickettsiales bacterium]|jgi:16S rRNA G966 N2-methylase RsmD|nr:RsmD family RNA methyltransferase [Rickettsiales bacterium]
MDSKLQIISGKFKGKKLEWPPSARPTSMRAKIALFNILMPIVKEIVSQKATDLSIPTPSVPTNPHREGDLTVWDAFAGSGAFGAEFISRGLASSVIFTDSDPAAVKIIRNNLKDMTGSSSITIEKAKMIEVAGKYAPKAGIIFLDPPYSEGKKLANTITSLSKFMKKDAILIVEYENIESPAATLNTQWTPAFAGVTNLETLTIRKYGRAGFAIFRKV